MNRNLVFLDSVLLQRDMRIRLPKSLLVNMNGKPGATNLEIYFDPVAKEIVIKNPNLNKNISQEG